MSVKEVLSEEIKSAPEDILKEIYDYPLFLKNRNTKEKIQTHIASERVLARDWNSAEEDEAWKNL